MTNLHDDRRALIKKVTKRNESTNKKVHSFLTIKFNK